MQQNILSEIEAFMAETGLSAYRVGWLAAKNGRLVERLRRGGRVWPEQETKIIQFIQSRRSIPNEHGAHAAACQPIQLDNSQGKANA